MLTTQGVKLDGDTRKRLEVLAKRRDRSPHWLMCAAIKQYVKREENYEREKQEDLERWERYVLTGEFIPHNKVVAWLEALAQGKKKSRPR
jgi:predicted transcriptional regulator